MTIEAQERQEAQEPAPPPDVHWRSRAMVLGIGTFAVGTDAYVIAGMLPEIARSLHVGLGAAGQLVTVFSLAYAISAPILATVTTAWSRRTVLVTALGSFALGNAATALAPDYGLILAARVVAAIGAGLYTGNASATAVALAGDRCRGRAIAIVMVGATSSLALGAPLGTALGAALDWRATMWAVTALGLLVVPVLALRIPALPTQSHTTLRDRLARVADRRVLGVLGVTVVAFVGIFVPYTYISAVYAPTVDGDGNLLAVLLSIFGVAGILGTVLSGRLSDRFGARPVVIVACAALTVSFSALPALRAPLATVIPTILVTAVFSFMVSTPQQHRMVALVAPDLRPMATSLHQSALYLAVALSGAVGAAGLEIVGSAWLGPLAAAFMAAGTVLAWAVGRPAPATTRARE